MQKYNSFLTVLAVISFMAPAKAEAREQIHIVGSSTVYPFVTAAAEAFGGETDFKTPIVEATGTGGGFKLFCSGSGDDTPDIANASRALKDSERDQCAKSGVTGITEIKIGYDGIVIANAKASPKYMLTKQQIFTALAKKIPVGGVLVDNPNKTWKDVDAALPDNAIEVYGPPPTSGTRDAFVELVMEPSCKDIPEFKAAYADEKERANACHLLREDGVYIDAGENDNIIIQKLKSNADALGVFGFSFLDQNADAVQGSMIDGHDPTFENIAADSYSVSRSLYVYIKNAHVKTVPGIKEFVTELLSSGASGEQGYLADKGLIPLHPDELKAMQAKAAGL